MGSKHNADLIIVIFNGIAALATLLTLLSPLFFNKDIFTCSFIDQNSIELTSFIALLSFILIIWLFVSVGSFILFGGKEGKGIANMEKIKIYSILSFFVSSLSFYSINILYQNDAIGFGLASVLQFASYICATSFLGAALGQTISSSIATYKNNSINASRNERITNALLSANIIRLNLEILSVQPNRTKASGHEWEYIVIFKTNRKQYIATFYGDFSRITAVKEYIPTRSR